MAYTKTNWVDRVVDGSGTVIVEGTPVNATNMNKIENAIEDLQGKAYKISLPVSSWTGSGPYTYVYPATGMTSDTTIDYTIDSTVNNLNGDLTITTGVGTITFSTPSLPSGTVIVTVMAVGVDADIQLIDWSSYCYSKDQAVAKADIVNNLTSTATNKPLSANMGKTLNEAIVQSTTTFTTLNVAFNVSGLNSSSKIFAYKYLNLLLVTGYLSKETSGDIAYGSTIATVSGVSLVQQMFDSPNSDTGDPTRIVLMTNGQIRIEKEMKTGQWYSFSFTALLNS